MKHILIILVFALTSSLHASTLTGIVTRVIDGDTVVVTATDCSTHAEQCREDRPISGETSGNPELCLLCGSARDLKVRLAEIDAPESDQAYGPEATAALSEMVLSNRVVVTWTKKDRYRRVIGTITVPHPLNLRPSAVDVNEELVRAGAAWQYTKYSESPTLKQAHATAQEQQLGLWKDTNPIAPWKFRRKC